MTSTIGIISVEQDPSFFAERYFREILTVASQAIAGCDCYLRIVALGPDQIAAPDATRAAFAAQGISAVLAVAPDPPLLTQLEALFRNMPSIIISAPRLDIPLSYVNSDNYGVTRQIVEHLAGLGRRFLRLLQPDEPSGDFVERARGYADAIAALGLEPLVGQISYPITDAIIDQRVLVGAPDALIAPDDTDALALLGHFQRRGLRVPDDIALVGFDDEDFAADTFPALTTVSQPLGEMARRAAGYLLDRLAGVERGVYQEVLPNRLIVRESCGARRSKNPQSP
jgi:DNA-binding LacI/PurR family transcriptional regulator